jgi:sugar-specific transcriptional regulator TrmB
MTNPYSAVYLTAFKYFQEGVQEKFNKIIEFGSEEEKAFKDFYKFIENEVEDNFFLENNSKEIVKYIKELLKKSSKEIIIETSDSKVNFIYFKMKQKS